MARAGLVWLEQNRDHVNALNVFPVPDGDTGTNMLLTMRSAYARVESSEENHVGRVAAQIAQGALMGARGNSGVILSQIWRGLAAELAGKETFTTIDLAAAFQSAADTAYKGVMRPVEGTICLLYTSRMARWLAASPPSSTNSCRRLPKAMNRARKPPKM